MSDFVHPIEAKRIMCPVRRLVISSVDLQSAFTNLPSLRSPFYLVQRLPKSRGTLRESRLRSSSTTSVIPCIKVTLEYNQIASITDTSLLPGTEVVQEPWNSERVKVEEHLLH
ncbi:hypothetical protein J6590_049430 [Homalodisca vitripennis]|nr:hypothetical protein J6590_049430 [Homalodisca vitripennis]